MVRCVLRCVQGNVANLKQRKKIWDFFRHRFKSNNLGKVKMDIVRVVTDKEVQKII